MWQNYACSAHLFLVVPIALKEEKVEVSAALLFWLKWGVVKCSTFILKREEGWMCAARLCYQKERLSYRRTFILKDGKLEWGLWYYVRNKPWRAVSLLEDNVRRGCWCLKIGAGWSFWDSYISCACSLVGPIHTRVRVNSIPFQAVQEINWNWVKSKNHHWTWWAFYNPQIEFQFVCWIGWMTGMELTLNPVSSLLLELWKISRFSLPTNLLSLIINDQNRP